MDVTIVKKGEAVALRGKNTVTAAVIGLGWDPNAGQSSAEFDLDASIVERDASGAAVEVCYYGNLAVGNYIKHTGDNLTGDGDGDDEQIAIDLGNVPANIDMLDVVVHIYEGGKRSQFFGMVENAYVRLNRPDGTEIIRHDLSNDAAAFTATGLFFARIRRAGPSWEFVAVDSFATEHATLDSTTKAVIDNAAVAGTPVAV